MKHELILSGFSGSQWMFGGKGLYGTQGCGDKALKETWMIRIRVLQPAVGEAREHTLCHVAGD
jgi:hypothetical protein